MDNGGPAFPIGSGDMRDPQGMSLRDYFAVHATDRDVLDFIDLPEGFTALDTIDPLERVRARFRFADAMVKIGKEEE